MRYFKKNPYAKKYFNSGKAVWRSVALSKIIVWDSKNAFTSSWAPLLNPVRVRSNFADHHGVSRPKRIGNNLRSTRLTLRCPLTPYSTLPHSPKKTKLQVNRAWVTPRTYTGWLFYNNTKYGWRADIERQCLAGIWAAHSMLFCCRCFRLSATSVWFSCGR